MNKWISSYMPFEYQETDSNPLDSTTTEHDLNTVKSRKQYQRAQDSAEDVRQPVEKHLELGIIVDKYRPIIRH